MCRMTDGEVASRASRMRDVTLLGLERVAVRTREKRNTGSAWCLSISSADGAGRVTLIESHGAGLALYRGDGVFLGWPRHELEAAYRLWLPPPPAPEADAGQLG
jgi:hypothetical protein